MVWPSSGLHTEAGKEAQRRSRYHARPMAVPKKRTSSARRDKRRATHKAAKAHLNNCPRCHSPRLPHRVCPTCGTYDGREVIKHSMVDSSSGGSEPQE
jgi:large subunit ribosomal protein L32